MPSGFLAGAATMVWCNAWLAAAPQLTAFPGAQGFGALTPGGRGGEVYHVTNLNDTGPGSLRDGVSRKTRTVVFDVGGVIRIKSPLVIASHLTVAGQSAPAPGITIYGNDVSLSHASNVILRYLRIRQGIGGRRGSKSLNVAGGTDMIFDHLSVEWGRWDVIGITVNSARITMQNCLLAEGIDPQRFGGLIDSSTDITLCGNLWLNNHSRNPKLKANAQYINNVVYNWGVSGVPGGHSAAVWRQDFINNLFIKGPSSSDKCFDLFAATDHVYQSGNIVDLQPNGKLDGRAVTVADFHGETAPTFQPAPSNQPPVAVTVFSVADAYRNCVAGAGASLYRDAVDNRLIEQVQSLGTKGAIIHNEAEVGGQPVVAETSRPPGFDTDGDGIPDAWELAHGLDPHDAADGQPGGAYTNLEQYLNSLVP